MKGTDGPLFESTTCNPGVIRPRRYPPPPQRLLWLALLIWLIASILPNAAQAMREDEECEQPCALDVSNYTALPGTNFSDDFNDHFTFYVEWNPYLDPWPWPADVIDRAADLIMPEETGLNFDYWQSVAHRVIQQFGADDDDGYGIELPFSMPVTHIGIYLKETPDSDGGNNGTDQIYIGLAPESQWWRNDEFNLANDGFAHELQHIVDGLNGGYGTIGTEYMSQCAEYQNGSFWSAPSEEEESDSDDLVYTASLSGPDYWSDCLRGGTSEDTYNGVRHRFYALFAPYLMRHLDVPEYQDDRAWVFSALLTRWLFYEEEGGATYATAGFKTLSTILGRAEYDVLFRENTGPDRTRAVLQRYAVACWLNAENDYYPDETASVWGNGSESPQETNGYLQNWDWYGGSNYDCHNDAWSHPLYNFVTEDLVTVGDPDVDEGRIYAGDLHYNDNTPCANEENADLAKHLTLNTYGFEILPFVADESIIDGDCRDLEVEITFENHVYCEALEDDLPGVGLIDDADQVHVTIIGYPEDWTDLEDHGEDAVILGEVAKTGAELNSNPRTPPGGGGGGNTNILKIVVPCFGTEYESVALILSVQEAKNYFVNDNLTSRIIPFSYSYVAEPASGYSVASGEAVLPWDYYDEEVGFIASSRHLCFSDDVTIASGAELTVEPRTRISLVGSEGESEIQVAGTLTIDGDPGEEVVLDGRGSTWDGITIQSGGWLVARDFEVTGPVALAASSGAAGALLDEGSLDFGEDEDGIDLEDCGSVTLEGLEVLTDRATILGDCTISDTDFQRKYTSPCDYGLKITGTADLQNVRLYDYYNGIWVDGGAAELEEVAARSPEMVFMTNVGVRCTSGAQVVIAGLTVEDFRKGVEAGGGSDVTMRGSKILDFYWGIYAGTAQGDVHDFGTSNDPGRNCFSLPLLQDPSGFYIQQTGMGTPPQLWAVGNYWSADPPSASDFVGNISYSGWLTECPSGSGGPNFLVAGPPASCAAGDGLALEISWEGDQALILCSIGTASAAAGVDFAVYDILGRLMWGKSIPLVDKARECTVEWNGRSSDGRQLASGVYLVRASHGSDTATSKVVFVR